MRRRFSIQGRLDGCSIAILQLNVEGRDEIIPILSALQYVFSENKLRSKLVDLVGNGSQKGSQRGSQKESFGSQKGSHLGQVNLVFNVLLN